MSSSHIYFILDRSGSMESIASDVIGGFNQFLRDQKADGDDVRMTLVQFDNHDPFEILADASPIKKVKALTNTTFKPRGQTPLYDAVARGIIHARARQAEVRGGGGEGETILFVIFTDGHENASREFNQRSVFEMIETAKAQDWTFVFMGANQDSYDTGSRLGISADSVQNYKASREGSVAAFESLSAAMLKRRAKIRDHEAFSSSDFFEGQKDAEKIE
jgi:Mg-chelatase subunit ChlD